MTTKQTTHTPTHAKNNNNPTNLSLVYGDLCHIDCTRQGRTELQCEIRLHRFLPNPSQTTVLIEKWHSLLHYSYPFHCEVISSKPITAPLDTQHSVRTQLIKVASLGCFHCSRYSTGIAWGIDFLITSAEGDQWAASADKDTIWPCYGQTKRLLL